eukprot:jgi/Botrbrau1/9351/Bobra.354_2s0009.1
MSDIALLIPLIPRVVPQPRGSGSEVLIRISKKRALNFASSTTNSFIAYRKQSAGVVVNAKLGTASVASLDLPRRQFGGPSLSRGVERQVGKVGRSRSLAITVLHCIGRSNVGLRAYAFAPVCNSIEASISLNLIFAPVRVALFAGALRAAPGVPQERVSRTFIPFRVSSVFGSNMVSVVLMLLATGATVLAQKPLGSWQNGIATNYGGAQDGMDPYSPSFGTKEGSCGYGVLDKEQYPFWSVAALAHSSPFYMAGPVQGCGQCFQIECVNDGSQFQGRCNSDPSERSVTVMITDSCPECASNQFDIQALTFNKIAPMAIGRIAMRYRRVECAPPANMEVKVDSFSGSGGWIRLMETAGPGAIKTVQVKGPNTGWQGMTNIWGAAWELNNCPQTPIDVRLVASDGQEVTAFGAIKSDGVTGVLPTWVQFSFGTVSRTAPSSSSGDSSDGEAMTNYPPPPPCQCMVALHHGILWYKRGPHQLRHGEVFIFVVCIQFLIIVFVQCIHIFCNPLVGFAFQQNIVQ